MSLSDSQVIQLVQDMAKVKETVIRIDERQQHEIARSEETREQVSLNTTEINKLRENTDVRFEQIKNSGWGPVKTIGAIFAWLITLAVAVAGVLK